MCDDFDFYDNELSFLEYLLDQTTVFEGVKLEDIDARDIKACKDMCYSQYKKFCKKNKLRYEYIF